MQQIYFLDIHLHNLLICMKSRHLQTEHEEVRSACWIPYSLFIRWVTCVQIFALHQTKVNKSLSRAPPLAPADPNHHPAELLSFMDFRSSAATKKQPNKCAVNRNWRGVCLLINLKVADKPCHAARLQLQWRSAGEASQAGREPHGGSVHKSCPLVFVQMTTTCFPFSFLFSRFPHRSLQSPCKQAPVESLSYRQNLTWRQLQMASKLARRALVQICKKFFLVLCLSHHVSSETIIDQPRGQSDSHLMDHVANLKQTSTRSGAVRVIFCHICRNICEHHAEWTRGKVKALVMSNEH